VVQTPEEQVWHKVLQVRAQFPVEVFKAKPLLQTQVFEDVKDALSLQVKQVVLTVFEQVAQVLAHTATHSDPDGWKPALQVHRLGLVVMLTTEELAVQVVHPLEGLQVVHRLLHSAAQVAVEELYTNPALQLQTPLARVELGLHVRQLVPFEVLQVAQRP
jgi:hypothetical protein